MSTTKLEDVALGAILMSLMSLTPLHDAAREVPMRFLLRFNSSNPDGSNNAHASPLRTVYVHGSLCIC